MRITTPNKTPKFNEILGSVLPGDCVQFKKPPHQKHATDAIFVVLRVPSQYIVEDERRTNGIFRIMVANLETGYCSLVVQDRAIRFINAEVVNNEVS